MTAEIDVRDVLTQLGYGRPDLVTRPTGRAVRGSIEIELARLSRPAVVVLDFTEVRLLDCSCADEIVAKLVQQYLEGEDHFEALFLLRGLHDHQITDIEEVVRSRRLALVAEIEGALRVIGEVGDGVRAAFGVMLRDAGFEMPLIAA
jgi:hypothetical protein